MRALEMGSGLQDGHFTNSSECSTCLPIRPNHIHLLTGISTRHEICGLNPSTAPPAYFCCCGLARHRTGGDRSSFSLDYTSGSSRTRIPVLVTLTAAPAASSDSAPMTTCSIKFATSSPFNPSIRMRIVDGVVLELRQAASENQHPM